MNNDFHANYSPGGQNDCWIWSGRTINSGYGCAQSPGRVTTLAHRLSYELHNGPIPDGMCVLHTCDVRLCVNPKHLWLGTHAENTRDMIRKGRGGVPPHRPGASNGNSKLTASQVSDIRKEYAAGGTTHRELSTKHGISRSHIHRILTNRNWSK